MIDPIKKALRFVRDNDHSTVRSHVLSHDAHPFLQFVKYGVCGVMATVVQAGIVYLLGLTVNPAVGTDIPVDLKESRTIVNNSIAFIFSGAFAYWINVKFVFRPGRHGKRKEIGLFFLISAISFFAGLLAIPLIFRQIESKEYVEHFANLGFIVSSALVNFVCRKFIIFKH